MAQSPTCFRFPLFSALNIEKEGEEKRGGGERMGERRKKEKVVNPVLGSLADLALRFLSVSCLFRRAVADEEIPRALTPTPRPTDGGEGVGGEPRLVEMPTAVTPSSGSLLLHLVST